MWVISSPQLMKDPELFVNCFSWPSRARISEFPDSAVKAFEEKVLAVGMFDISFGTLAASPLLLIK